MSTVLLAVTIWVLVTARGHTEPAFPVWAVLVLGLAVGDVLVAVSGAFALETLDVRANRRNIIIVSVTLGVVLLLGAVAAVDWILGVRPNRGFVLVCITALATIPSVASFTVVAYGTLQSSDRPVTQLVEEVRTLSTLTRRLLSGAGSLVALATASLGAASILQHQRVADGDLAGTHISSPTIIVFGAVGSALVAAAYLPAALRIRIIASHLAANLFPLPPSAGDNPVGPGQDIIDALRDRAQLLELLGASRSVWSDLQSGIVIIAPLLAAGATAFISPNTG